MDSLLVPRKVTRLLLVTAGLGLGALAWMFLTAKLIAVASGLAGSFCLLCATAVWGIRDKADSGLSGEHLSAEAFLVVRSIARRVRHRSFWRAAYVALAALVGAGPAVSMQVSSEVWQWMVLLAGAAAGEAAYSYIVAEAWDEEVRAEKDKQIAAKKLNAERAALIDRLEKPSASQGVVGWTSGPEIPVDPVQRH